ncbi:hypothetical protein [Streptomyces sp. NPDC002758]
MQYDASGYAERTGSPCRQQLRGSGNARRPRPARPSAQRPCACSLETEDIITGKAKRIVSDAEAARLRAAEDEAKQAAADAEHLAALKKKLGITPRANGSAYRPFRGGLPTLGKDR